MGSCKANSLPETLSKIHMERDILAELEYISQFSNSWFKDLKFLGSTTCLNEQIKFVTSLLETAMPFLTFILGLSVTASCSSKVFCLEPWPIF